MNVLITGAFGNIGTNAIYKLLEKGHKVRGFDLETKVNEKTAWKLKDRIDVVWGDVRSTDDVATAVQDQDVVVHLAFVLPPLSEDRPEWAGEINVGGTQKLLDAMKSLSPPPKIIFSSSFSVFGPTYDQPPPRTVSDPVQPIDNYSKHKVECEKLVRESGLDWAVLRFGVAPPMSIGGVSPTMFDIPPSMRTEFIHPQDAGLAIANAVSCEEAWGKILLIGSGPSGQIYYRDFIGRMMNAMGMGTLPESAFSPEPSHTYTDWLDTEESQRLLNYQQHTFEEFVREVASLLGYKRHLIPLFRPLIRRWVLGKSPYYRTKG